MSLGAANTGYRDQVLAERVSKFGDKTGALLYDDDPAA
jgi:hypothetical protein